MWSCVSWDVGFNIGGRESLGIVAVAMSDGSRMRVRMDCS